MDTNNGVFRENWNSLEISDTIKLGYVETILVEKLGNQPLNYKFIVNNKKQIVDYLSRVYMSETYLVGIGDSERIIVTNEPDVKFKLLKM
ncbi:hypothetical protein P4493_05620 [Bacillus thuringiensis]|uniref:Uncharacterized protein n=3 Tax=Bacillus thuringiensis TaxID=1428 RepID=A0A0B5NK61_BACTU|nr:MULTISPECIES: hypothetical protein [Bacillus]MEC2534099.1 hypothetical protein [Bacillus cereus]MED1153524.1 hypothetical protein [Bacillus paranthracis]OUB09182.1 hypothetical protein BK708_32105 [Bacillus thuringiensis serovar yunnanensis]AFQ29852.1 hypothetical protein BTF1_28757 [Bacillus thuringiensis HD-789]AJG73807.1 hypothetical protein BF38_6096 [Bacillus thuringiensis]